MDSGDLSLGSDCGIGNTNREERNFRRGFHHGAYEAVTAIFEEGLTETEARRWLDRLFRWRHSRRDYRAKGPACRYPPDPRPRKPGTIKYGKTL